MRSNFETYEEQVQFHIKGIEELEALKCLDEGLFEILLDLNKREFMTCSSCSGHMKGNGARGSIHLIGPVLKPGSKDNLLWLLQRYGLKEIKLEDSKGNTSITFKAMGSPYHRLLDECPQDSDSCFDAPLERPGQCATCGKSDFWLHGETYNDKKTLNWLCKHCQPRPPDTDADCLTPAIIKKLKELPKLKVWEIYTFVNGGKKKVIKMVQARNQYEITHRLGYDRDKVFIQRIV